MKIEPLKLAIHPMDLDPNDDIYKLWKKLNEIIYFINNQKQ